MQARVFKSGNSQAIRIPKEYRFDTDVVDIFKRGDELIIKARQHDLGKAFDLLTSLPDDFMQDGRQDEAPQEREAL